MLTKREKEITDLFLEGYTIDEIAHKLFISPKTARTHRARIYQKLNVHSLSELFLRRIKQLEKERQDIWRNILF